jgi:hypothetical protein
MNFWTGIIIGVFMGTNIGIAVAGILAGSKRSDDAESLHLGQYPMDEAVIDDAVRSRRAGSSLPFSHSEVSCSARPD